MNLPSVRLLSAAAAALMLGACASQNPAPVVDGTSGAAVGNTGIYNPNTGYTPPAAPADNPYGATPYNPNAGAAGNGTYVPPGMNNTTYTPPAANAPYTPPATTANNGTYVPPVTGSSDGRSGTYVGNYAPVDTNATHHRVVAGDTVFNISKRYGISQESLRAWNNLSGNTIGIGQTLRVKASGNNGIGNTSGGAYTPAASGGQTHRVVAGDTVFNISKRYGISQETLRSLNGLSGNNIQIGQVLRISSKGYTAPATAAAPYTPPPASVTQTTQTVTTETVTTTAPAASVPVAAATPVTATHNNIVWQSPLTNVTVSQPYNTTARRVELSGQPGQPVMAAADGQVIFSGAGPRGYGNMVVVQHSSQYLTAYGNNEKLLVKEMEKVSRGQALASLGSNGKMTFEIRENGKPLNPQNFIRFN